MTSRTTGMARAVVLLAAIALLTAGLVSPATAATSTGTLKGVVSLNGTPIDFAKVQVYRLLLDRENEEYVVADTKLKTDNTDSRGRYSFSLSAKTASTSRYVILVTDRTGKAVTTSRTVVAKRGKTVTKNVRLKPAATLTGTVNTSDGRSPAGFTVEVDPGSNSDKGPSYEKLYPQRSATVKPDGTFVLSGLPSPASYDEVLVSDGPYAVRCYDFVAGTLAECATGNDQPSYAAQQISLATSERRTLPTVTMSTFAPPPTKLTGKITDTSGRALRGVTVRLVSGTASATAATRSSGRYTPSTRASPPAPTRSASTTRRRSGPRSTWAAAPTRSYVSRSSSRRDSASPVWTPR